MKDDVGSPENAVLVAGGAIGDDGDTGAALGLAGVGIAGDAAGEDCDIGHVVFLQFSNRRPSLACEPLK